MQIKKLTIITSQFKYSFEHDKNVLKITNDGDAYTVSELRWDYLKDYDVYNFEFIDIKIVDIASKIEKTLKDQILYSFDVSPDG